MSTPPAYSSDGTYTTIRRDLAEELDMAKPTDGPDSPSDYMRHCGHPDHMICGDLHGMDVHELRQLDDFARLSLDQANRLLQWLRDEADRGVYYGAQDHAHFLDMAGWLVS